MKRKGLAGPVEDFDLTLEEDVRDTPDMLDIRLHAVTAQGRRVGEVHVGWGGGRYAAVETANIDPAYRGKGLYPEMLMTLLEIVQEYGAKGIVSTPDAREGVDSLRSWEKFAKRLPRRVRRIEGEDGPTFTLE